LAKLIIKEHTFRIAAWLCFILLTYLSLIPAEFEIRTGAPGGLEHLIAYLGTALLFGMGYPLRHIRIVIGLVAYSGLMEALQYIPPDRHPSIYDALNSSTGAILGTVAAALALKQIDRFQRKPSALTK
jgi:VanZ family protein